ncbi:MAG: matrixin family metalloprotease [Candidatus Gastranaerophilaceae bacterium]|nr:matrixin family metalloprotease [Candidatus Gastranaerophilaceae bacterium]
MNNLLKYIRSTFNYVHDIDTKSDDVNPKLQLLDYRLYKVFVTPIDIDGYQDKLEHCSEILQKALNEWAAVLNNKIKFKVVYSLQGADVKLYWIRSKRRYAARQNWDNNTIHPMPVVNMGIVDMEGNPYSDSELYHLCLHEFGHILTLGHSPDPKDCMCGGGDWNPYLTANDKFVARLIYSLGSGVSYSEKEDYIKAEVKKFLSNQTKANTANEFYPPMKISGAEQSVNLLHTLQSIEEIAKYELALQDISLNEISKKFFHKPKYVPSLETM